MKFTAREKKLLYLLLIVVLVAGFVLGLQKLTTKTQAREDELAELQNESNRLRLASDTLGDIKKTLPEIEKETRALQAVFSPYVTTPFIDDKITQTAIDCGLTPYVLTLTEPVNRPVPYCGAEDTGEVGGMFWTAQASFTAYGRESALLSFLDAAQADASMHVRSFTYTGSRSGTLQILFELDVYMYTPTEDIAG